MEDKKEFLLTCAENGIYYKHYGLNKKVDAIYYLGEEDLLIDFANERLVWLNRWEDSDDPTLYICDEFKLEDYHKEWSINKEELLWKLLEFTQME